MFGQLRTCREWAYGTQLGDALCGDSMSLVRLLPDSSVSAIITSPPFALLRKKPYGNKSESEYVDWFMPFAEEFSRVLTDDGSLVIEIGGAWLPRRPAKSVYQFELLVRLVRETGFLLAEDFYWYNPAKMPGPAQWVTIERIRVKDSVSCIWWLSKSERPKADNRKVLKPYSESHRRLLATGKYNEGRRPSGHVVRGRFASNNGGAIPPNIIQASNTRATDEYQAFCRDRNLAIHPARFPVEIPEFFISFLTDPNDLVLDPFAGSNITGALAERLGRRWISYEIESSYVVGSVGRFQSFDSLEISDWVAAALEGASK